MSLPDISRFASLPAQRWRALAQRLRALGITPSRVAPIVAAANRLAPPLRQPLRAWHLRKQQGPAGHALRILFNDPVTAGEAREALGELLDPLVELGLLRARDDGSIASPFVFGIVDDLYVISDDLSHGDDAVMGLGPGTVGLCRAVFRGAPVRSALDLGCGAGSCALVLSRCAARVVGTDINPRAIALARVNAMLNGVTNLELREGDLFAPVAGETFDLIASQPPFVSRPDGAVAFTFLYGGRVGDELALRLLSGTAQHLSPEGRAVFMVEWPDHGAQPIEERVRAAVGSDALDLLLLQTPEANLDEHAASYAYAMHPSLDAAFEREALGRRDHLEQAGIRALRFTITVLQRCAAPPGFTETVAVQPLSSLAVTSDRIDKILAARAVAGDDERLLAAALRVPEGTIFSEEQLGPGSEIASTISARFSASALVPLTQMTADLLGLVTILHEAASVREGLERFADAYEVPFADALAKVLPSVRRALLDGLLELA